MPATRLITPDDQPDVVPWSDRFGGRSYYRGRRPWDWEWNGILIQMDAGYIYDGASIPRLARMITGYSPDGTHRAAAVAHDIGCTRKGVLVSGALLGRPQYQAVLWGNPPDQPGHLDYAAPVPTEHIVGQLTRTQVHQMWGDLLHATEGSYALKKWILHTGVRIGGPWWKMRYPGWKTS